jgi:hypothetical protein
MQNGIGLWRRVVFVISAQRGMAAAQREEDDKVEGRWRCWARRLWRRIRRRFLPSPGGGSVGSSENREVTRNPWPRSSRGRSRTGDGAQQHDPVWAMWRGSWPATACVWDDLGRRAAAHLTMHGSLAVREMRSGEGQWRRSRLGLIWAQRTQAVSPILCSTVRTRGRQRLVILLCFRRMAWGLATSSD